MPASVTTTAHGVRVVTHIYPLDEKTETSVTGGIKVHSSKPKLSEMTRMFFRGQPEILGIVQIFTGLLMVVIGINTAIASTLLWEIPVGLGIACIISGSVSVAARRGTNSHLIKGTFAMNIISSVLALAGVVYFCIALSDRPESSGCKEYRYSWNCQWMFIRYMNMLDGIKGLLLTLAVLEICVSVSLSVFSAKAIRRTSEPESVPLTDPESDEDSHYSSKSKLVNDCAVPLNPPSYEP
ncbi:membrane-spanning 4-domains subfamily A member 4A [Chanos chanos]|uniref:Membrane-spanning 4-domains subfamily A member 4A n=1 Tax=Chanos chanos TaxID=29144 RepID=A0A6J2W0D9_CHACN|nr:membrane-spanning 4-domains subfamily A member 4A-like [Chanos chanos]